MRSTASTVLVLGWALCTSSAFAPAKLSSVFDLLQSNEQTTTSLHAMTLYGSQGSRSPLVNWAANELKLDLEMASDLSRNPHPFGQIPCLTDDGDVMVFESGAILQYLQAKSKGDAAPDSKSGAISSWISWANASLDPICFLETPDGKVYDTGLKSQNKRIAKLDEILSGSSYLVGDEFSLADVAVASYLLYVIQFFPDVDLMRWPNIVEYMKACASREGYGKAFGDRVQGYCVSRLSEMQKSGGGKEKKLFGVF